MKRPIVVIAASVAIAAAVVPAAVAADGTCPQVEVVKLTAAPGTFGGSVDTFVRNGPGTIRFCLSGRCAQLSREGAGRYAATGQLFNTRLRSGQRRRVRIVARRGEHRAVWGPRRVTVRR